MIANVCFFDCDNNPEIGHQFYLISLYFTNLGTSRLDSFSEPQRTNMSRDIRIKGWLGTTDNVDKEALGKFQVLEVLSKPPKYFLDGVKVLLVELD